MCESVKGRNRLLTLESIALNQVVWVPHPPGATATQWPWMTILSIVNSWKKVYPPQRIAVRVKWVHRYKLFWGYLVNGPPCTPEESGAYSKSSFKVTGKLESQPEPRHLTPRQREKTVHSLCSTLFSVCHMFWLPPPTFRSLSLSPLPSSLSLCLSSPHSSSLSLETWRLGNPPPHTPAPCQHHMCIFFFFPFFPEKRASSFQQTPEASVTPLSTRVDMALAAAVFHPEQKLSWRSEKWLYSSVSVSRCRREREAWPSCLPGENDCILKAQLRLFWTVWTGRRLGVTQLGQRDSVGCGESARKDSEPVWASLHLPLPKDTTGVCCLRFALIAKVDYVDVFIV